MILVEHLTKRFGDTVAVNDLSFEVRPGAVTGFVGPNGSGKTTTMRCMLNLARPSSGHVSIDGKVYAKHHHPMHVVGAVLDAKAFHPGRTAKDHLYSLAVSNGIPKRRVGEVLEMVGLTSVAKKRAGKFSLGMSQRLGIAAAMLGDPGILIFDEPMNGLDPDGVRWVRDLMRAFAGEGKAVLVSSHLLSEMALVADELVVIGRGSVLANESAATFMERNARQWVSVRVEDLAALETAIGAAGGVATRTADGALDVTGIDIASVGALAFHAGLMVTELAEHHESLEDVFLELTADSVEYRAPGAIPTGGQQ
ncbi:MAG: ATP-binding cassette domain-containing protein [Acidimicrobiia bacterium]